ncbi:hypothetical protein JZ751_001324 [Albula glossodonta]|uniref:Folylpoly-gamma-glutamate synthetase n=1 Tax=Albula glossodonta TaxID=121402 RepID=A0A8T2PTH5_9TELE|nr:hypothetical protein JZ751_001324 [Albula glossodonta]
MVRFRACQRGLVSAFIHHRSKIRPVRLPRMEYQVEELDELNAIHVAGTKGKYSSPHLVQVRERIRIDGHPISKELFTKYFWQVYEQLEATKDAHAGSMPSYFLFLTILAFHVFLQEKVDVAVIEVGIGGAYDCTNVIRKPWVCGISSLGIDHTNILGDTIEKIAWQKAGIFKCPLSVCPDLRDYPASAGPLHPGLVGQHQQSNASLALQLCRSWLQRHHLAGTHVHASAWVCVCV